MATSYGAFIPEGTFIFGRMECEGKMILDGALVGWLIGRSDIIVGMHATVLGGVLAPRLVSFGSIVGRAVGIERVNLKATSSTIGPLRSRNGALIVEEGAVLCEDIEQERLQELLHAFHPARDAARFYVTCLAGSPPNDRKFVLTRDFRICGDLRYTGDLLFDGTLEQGRIVANRLVIGENAAVHGDCIANSIVVYGAVYGELFARTECQLTRRSRVQGTIRAADCRAAPGASLNGTIMEGFRDEHFFAALAKLRNPEHG